MKFLVTLVKKWEGINIIANVVGIYFLIKDQTVNFAQNVEILEQ